MLAANAEPQYPSAAREATAEMIHGVKIEDPYRWMESTGSGLWERDLEHEDAWLPLIGKHRRR